MGSVSPFLRLHTLQSESSVVNNLQSMASTKVVPISKPSNGSCDTAELCSNDASAGPLVESFSRRIQRSEHRPSAFVQVG